MGARRKPRCSAATWLPGSVSADWRAGEDPEAVSVEVLFADAVGLSYVVHAVGPSFEAAVAAAEDEARRYLGCESATDWRAA